MYISKIEKNSEIWNELINYAKNCSWIVGKHLAGLMAENSFTEWEGVFAAVSEEKIVGFCTFMKTDYYPENRYSPWISCIFVDEAYRGCRISEKMIETVIAYAKEQGFSNVYIPSDISGLYEKYGFEKIDTLQNYGGDFDNIFAKEI